MTSRLAHLAVSMTMLSLVLVACSGAAPTPAPVKDAPAPPKAAEPAQATAGVPIAPTAQPSVVTTGQAGYPAKGKSIRFIVPYPAGGSSDISARSIAPSLENDLGAPVQIINESGAGSQQGLTTIAKANPDGYTIGQAALPSNLTVYLDPERQAAFGRKDFQTVANYGVTPIVITVKADSPFKSAKELVEAAKAKPGSVGVADTGLLTVNHLGTLIFEQAAGVKFKAVHFEGGGPAMNALLGGHVDVLASAAPTMMSQLKSGYVRVLGIMSDERNQYYPDMPTLAEQGYKASLASSYGVIVPAGTPSGIVSTLSASVKRAVDSDEFRKRLIDAGQTPTYMDSQAYAAYWDQQSAQVEPLIPLARQ